MVEGDEGTGEIGRAELLLKPLLYLIDRGRELRQDPRDKPYLPCAANFTHLESERITRISFPQRPSGL